MPLRIPFSPRGCPSFRLILVLAVVAAPGCDESSSPDSAAIDWIEELGGHAVRNDAERVIYVNLAATPAGSDHLKSLAELQHLRILHLEGTKVTDAGLNHLIELADQRRPSLRNLYLNHTRITNEGLAHLAEMRSLRKLSLTGTRITDAGLPKLCPLKHLQHLELRSYWTDPRGDASSMARNLSEQELESGESGPRLRQLLTCPPGLKVRIY